MKIVLISPPFDLFREGYGTRRPIKRGQLPPLGVGYIASAAVKEGHQVSILDASACGYSLEEACDIIVSMRPDVIGISSMTSTIDRVGQLALAIKEKRSDIPIILGGPHGTCFPAETLRDIPCVDYVVIGEGEPVIGRLLKAIETGEGFSELNGIAYRIRSGYEDKVFDNGKASLILNLDEIERPARELYTNELYSPLPYSYRQLPATTMITSRGCPYSRCKFCYSSGKMKERYRRHSPERVVDEMEELNRKFGMREIVFCDDNFLFDKNWILKFSDLLKTKSLGVTWSCAGRVDTVDEEMLKAVSEAGCWTVFYGLESGVQELLDIIQKGITLEETRRAIELTHKAGMETRGSFMLALPEETPDLARRTIQFAIDLDLTYAQFTATFPDVGTELYDIAKAKGRIGPYRGMNKATFVPEGYKNEEEVEKTVQLAYRRFYMRPRYILKKISSIRNLSDIARYIEGFLFVKGLT